ncbi:MAG: MBL fold metallo-hydrolase [Tepidiformaceae bacterium]
MEINWLGRNCFRLRGRDGVVITDPCPKESGYTLGKPPANIVTLSRKDDPGYSAVAAVGGEPRVLDAPGDYEIGGILIHGVAVKRADGTRNVIFVAELDGVKVAHLGQLTSAPTAATLEEVGDVDVLLIPVGGANALTGALAQDIMTAMDPRIAIPMNYKTEAETMDLDPLERFLKETGSKVEPLPRLQVSKSSLPAELSVVVLGTK